MSEEAVAAESAEVEDSPKSEQPSQNEEKARAMGWRPQNEFNGDPAKWRDADEFLKRGESEIPLIRAENRRLQASLNDVKKALKTLAEHHSKTEERAYTKAFNQIKQQQLEAARNGDEQGFLAAEQAITELAREVNSTPKIQQEAATDPVFVDWQQQNPWYNRDAEPGMVDFANTVGARLREQGVAGQALLVQVSRAVEQQFAHKFKPATTATPRSGVESGGRAATGGGKGFDSLPADAKSAFKELQKLGIKTLTKEYYAKEFFENEAARRR